jgi:hypothetical protein
MGFLLDINYIDRDGKSSTYESLFLGKGWGIRDVRGPYLTQPRGTLAIAPWALSRRVGSEVHLRFGLSNRCPVDALIFGISGRFGASSQIIQRNSEADVVLADVTAASELDVYQIDVALHEPAPENVLKFMDILSIDRISIRRSAVVCSGEV